jgi:outer membrane protein
MNTGKRLLLALVLSPLSLWAQAWPGRPALLESLIAEALQSNAALQARQADVEQARQLLEQARSAYQPRLDFVARYTVADGGRSIDLPIGDLINPAYASLNQLLGAHGQVGAFPQVQNQSIPFLRNHEQETKLRLVQPLYRPEISRGVAARRAGWESREASLAAYRRELRLQVESAFFRCRQAESVVGILQSAGELTAEALRVNRLLLEADKVTEDRVLRAEADDLAVRQQALEAERDRELARAYLNFLLNRPLTTPVPALPEAEMAAYTQATLAAQAPETQVPEKREELASLQKAIAAAEAAEQMEQSKQKPTLALAVEGGTQGERYETGAGRNFVQGSLVAEFNLWDGQGRRASVLASRAERRKLEHTLTDVRQKLSLEVIQARGELRATLAAYASAARRREASAKVFDLVKQREREGMASQLSFLDARNELTRAELNLEITRQKLLLSAAMLDRALALTPLP